MTMLLLLAMAVATIHGSPSWEALALCSEALGPSSLCFVWLKLNSPACCDLWPDLHCNVLQAAALKANHQQELSVVKNSLEQELAVLRASSVQVRPPCCLA